MILGVGLQVVNVDVRQAREEQLQLLLIEDGDQPRQKKDDAMLEYEDTIVPPGDYVVESLQESTELFPDGSSHLHLTNQLDVISLVVISHLERQNVSTGQYHLMSSTLTMTLRPSAMRSLVSVTPNSWISVEKVWS